MDFRDFRCAAKLATLDCYTLRTSSVVNGFTIFLFSCCYTSVLTHVQLFIELESDSLISYKLMVYHKFSIEQNLMKINLHPVNETFFPQFSNFH